MKVFSGAGIITQLGIVKLGFMDGGTLETASGNYEWKSTGSSKIWTDSDKNAVMFIYLENDAEKTVSVLSAENLDEKVKELLHLCGWYLLVVEYRAVLLTAISLGCRLKAMNSKKQTNSTRTTQIGGK